ncbi:MAG: DUF6206 family protein [Actinomycetota bacterium]
MEAQPYELPEISDQELLALEATIQVAQRRRSLEGLKVLGFGEVSIAVGWPVEQPRFVAKRLIPVDDAAELDEPLAAIDEFVAGVRSNGGNALPHATRRIQRDDGRHVGYVVQPLVPADELAEKVLERETPEAGHPLLVAVRDFVMATTDDHLIMDAQVPNFAWRDDEVWLLDITSPASFDANDKLVYPNLPLANQLVPALLRPALGKASTDIYKLYRYPHGALTQVAVFLHRVHADAWVEPAIATFNEVLDEPIDPAVVAARWERNVKDFPRVKKLLMIQRAWQENVRRRPYEYLITDSFTGEVL